ncbi:MAG: phosphatase PAP2 family protein [Parcubacteria group bacterium]|nr:phosphatase PAP2 family protein [Parcubacteria group bacterium]
MITVFGNVILSFDTQAFNFFSTIRESPWLQVFSTVTWLGEWYVAGGFLVAVSIALWFFHKRVFIFPFLTSVAGAEVFTYLLKNIIARPRPEMAEVIENSFSFPSGHATIAVALYGFLAYILFRMCRTRKEKIVVSVAAVFIVLLIGFSRLYLGVHYVSDVIAGYLVGALWLSIGMCLTEHFLERKKQA